MSVAAVNKTSPAVTSQKEYALFRVMLHYIQPIEHFRKNVDRTR